MNKNKEFEEFLSLEPSQVPDALSKRVLKSIHESLHPSAWVVFSKVIALQAVVGLFTLLFCPQFGISFTSGMGLMHYLMPFGMSVCMLGCGAIFTSASFFVLSLALRVEEIRVVKQNELLQLALVSCLSLLIFFYFGAELALSLSLVWMLGAILGGAISFEAGWFLRRVIKV